jgi:hypothetical protein
MPRPSSLTPGKVNALGVQHVAFCQSTHASRPSQSACKRWHVYGNTYLAAPFPSFTISTRLAPYARHRLFSSARSPLENSSVRFFVNSIYRIRSP